MIQGEPLAINFTLNDTTPPDLNTADEIEVAILVNKVRQLLFKKTEATPELVVTVDGTSSFICGVIITPAQSTLFPEGQLQAELKVAMPGDVITKAQFIIDIVEETYTD